LTIEELSAATEPEEAQAAEQAVSAVSEIIQESVLPEPTVEAVAPAAAAVASGAPADPLVEAAVAMVKEATEKELAGDAAAAPDSPASSAVDPATLEHVIRGVVGELMPQIVAQVKSALKS
jgi:hypothetical protein